ncbi:MAG: hypothetical protein LBS42_07815 [Tannerella sp.]|jgi:hypothetical protein|nr:hypothetical protein [Tannerella sp.]
MMKIKSFCLGQLHNGEHVAFHKESFESEKLDKRRDHGYSALKAYLTGFKNLTNLILTLCVFMLNTAQGQQHIKEPYKSLSGSFSGEQVSQSPDPLVAYRWKNPQATDSLEIYTLSPISIRSDKPEHVQIKDLSSVRVKEECVLMFDFGQVNAAWFEFDSKNFDGEIEMSISEYNEPAVFTIGAEHPVKTMAPKQYGDTYRLELNRELYEGVRFAWIHVKKLNRPADLSNIRLVCQVKPVNYEGSFSCSDTMLTRIWYTGAYDVKLNLLHDYIGAILMERSDRHSWTGDAHPSQAASMVAFGNYEFVKTNIRHTSLQANGIASYSLYWTLSLIDYYNYTGDKALFDEMLKNFCGKLDIAYTHFDRLPRLNFYGWDERLGAGFENPNCRESQNAYRMLCIRAWNEAAVTLAYAGYAELSDKYWKYASEKAAWLRQNPRWMTGFGIHAAADAVNAGFVNRHEEETLWSNAFSDRQQRLSYSPFNQYFIIQAMARMKRYSEAITTIDDCWGGQIRYGGTTFFEVFRPSWNDISKPNDAPVNNQCGYASLTHPWSAGVTKWLSEEIVGIKPLEPGFKSFIIKPHLYGQIRWVKGCTPSLHGTISFAFNAETGKGECTVPPGTSATIAIPKTGRNITEISFTSKNLQKHGEDDEFVYYSGLTEGVYSFDVRYEGYRHVTAQEPFTYELNPQITEDTLTRGNWTGRYGSKGYLLCNYDGLKRHRMHLPDFVDSVQFDKEANVIWLNPERTPLTNETEDVSALVSGSGDERRGLGAITTNDPHTRLQTMTVDIRCNKALPYRLSLYFVDWGKTGRRSAIEIFNLDDKKLLTPVYMIRKYENGKYVTLELDRPVRIRINQVRGDKAVLSGLFFD